MEGFLQDPLFQVRDYNYINGEDDNSWTQWMTRRDSYYM